MDRISKSTPKNIIDLYTKIPDYAEVKHLGNSEFINTIEKLKEEFRQIRSSLYEDSDEAVETVVEKVKKDLNIGRANNKSACGVEAKRFNYLSSRCNSSGNYFFNENSSNNHHRSNYNLTNPSSYLAVRSCQLYRSPFAAAVATSGQNLNSKSDSPLYYSSSKFSNTVQDSKTDSAFHEIEDEDSSSLGSESTSGSSPLSHWSSNPEISHSTSFIPGKYREYVPPSNTISRSLLRNCNQNRSEPVLTKSEENYKPIKPTPVPAHVKKLLFDKIMTNNKKRSLRVRELSKQKLLSQVKPFSFTTTTTAKRNDSTHFSRRDRFPEHTKSSYDNESLNNTKPVKYRKPQNSTQSIKTNNNRFDSHMFKANPAPPRSRALLSAIRLREQQEYRELKKRLRAETLMKTASLPPSMAARDKETKDNHSRLQTILQKLENSSKKLKSVYERRRQRSSSTDSTTFTDDDRGTTENNYSRLSRRKFRFQTPREKAKATTMSGGVFESTSNDNNASRLRVQAAKRKEEERIKREEEEQLRLMRMENARQNLREAKLQVWRHACSYSSAQDIAMRKQIREVSSILERQAFQKQMSTMLNRVQSAPLLLEGVRERKFEPCKKHLQEMLSGRSTTNNATDGTKNPNLKQTFRTKRCWRSKGEGMNDTCGTEFNSETAALAEGTLTNSDNESVKNIQLDSDDEVGQSEKVKEDDEEDDDEESVEDI